jgi:1-acyl-sn-glycerol-3-phosphate acyltransferase
MGRIMSIWFAIVLILFKLIAFPIFFILLFKPYPKGQALAHQLNIYWSKIVFYLSGIRIHIIGKEKIDKNGTYVFTPNHNSYLDIPVCNIAVSNPFRFIGKKELSKVPLFGWMYKRLYVTVDRKSPRDSYRSYLRSAEFLKQGISMMIYPEGTIGKNKVILSAFKEGAFRVAIQTQVPVVPISLIGTDRILKDDGKFLLYPGKVTVIFHEPISTVGLTENDITPLKNKVHDLLYYSLTPTTA